MYFNFTFGADRHNVIILFDHYLQANLKLYVININTSSHFIS